MFKQLHIILFLLCWHTSFSQRKADTTWVYIDSVRYNLSKIFISQKNIKQLYRITPEEERYISAHSPGKICIERKKKSLMVSLQEMVASVRKSENVSDKETINVLVDKMLIANPEGYYIEESYIKKISVVTSPPEERSDHKYHGTSLIITTNE